MKRNWVLAAVAGGALVLILGGLLVSGKVRGADGAPLWAMFRRGWQRTSSPAVRPDDPVLQLPVPVADPLSGLAPSPLNAFLKPGITPQEQTDVIGQLLLDYWNNLRTLPSGTWEEICSALAGANAKGIAFVPRDHPALARDAFRPAAGAPGVHIHVISASGGAFQLIYDGPDSKPFTDDDLIRNFPADLDY